MVKPLCCQNGGRTGARADFEPGTDVFPCRRVRAVRAVRPFRPGMMAVVIPGILSGGTGTSTGLVSESAPAVCAVELRLDALAAAPDMPLASVTARVDADGCWCLTSVRVCSLPPSLPSSCIRDPALVTLRVAVGGLLPAALPVKLLLWPVSPSLSVLVLSSLASSSISILEKQTADESCVADCHTQTESPGDTHRNLPPPHPPSTLCGRGGEGFFGLFRAKKSVPSRKEGHLVLLEQRRGRRETWQTLPGYRQRSRKPVTR